MTQVGKAVFLWTELMTMTEQQPPLEVLTREIDHPRDAAWYSRGLALMASDEPEKYKALKDCQEYQALQERFGRSDDVFRYLINNLGAISINVDTKRSIHEQTNYHVLEVAANGLVSADALGEYRTYAGNHERAGEYIVWFAKVVTAAYTNYFRLENEHASVHPEGEKHDKEKCRSFEEFLGSIGGQNGKSMNKISLDLGGKRQSGDWNVTGDLDTWAELLGSQIIKADHRAEVTLARTEAEQIRGYKLYPWQTRNDKGNPDPAYTSATIRRRRREAIIRIPGLREIVIIKESKGWLLPGEIEEDYLRDHVGDALRNWNPEVHGVENSRIAREVGEIVFERAIVNRDTTREIIPVHAHYYMQSSRDLPEVPRAS